MEGERDRLNRRILALTEQLADAKFTNSVETLNVRSFSPFKLQADSSHTGTIRGRGGKLEN